MRGFLVKIGILTSIFLFFILGFLTYGSFKTDRLIRERIQPETKILFMGDSHVMQAIQDAVIPQSLNISTTGESYIFTYYKLKRILDLGLDIEEVYLGYSYHNLSSYYDALIDGEKSIHAGSKRFYFLSPAGMLEFLYLNYGKTGVLLSNSLKQIYEVDDYVEIRKYVGCFLNEFSMVSVIDSSVNKRIQSQYYTTFGLRAKSNNNLKYLKKIAELCKEREIDLVLFNTPLHQSYINRVPKYYKDLYAIQLKELDIPVIDLSQMELNAADYIPDGDHVSVKGAYLTTIEFEKKREEIIKGN